MGGNAFLADITRQTGLDVCIAVNKSQQSGTPSPTLLKSTAAAIVGAVWLDSDRNMATVQRVVRHLR